jgi:hypothetical protein
MTVTPGTELPKASITNATSGEGKTVFTVDDCPEPLSATMAAGVPGIFVKGNVAGTATPEAVAITI